MLKDRIILVTGASRGIGAATARLLAKNGASVAVNYARNKEAADGVIAAIKNAGGQAIAVQADVTVRSEVEQMVRTVEEKLGPIDTLVSNASIGFPITSFMNYTWEDFEAKLMGELKAAFFCSRAVLPNMLHHKKGCIIAVSSSLSRHPGFGFCAHSAAKSALDGFMKSLALELGPCGIRVNTIAPGLTLTDATAGLPDTQKQAIAGMTPLRRNGLPEDIAGAILLMAMEQAGFVTGTYVTVDGGAQML